MLFLSLNNANIDFDIKDLIWRSYTAIEALPTTSQVELINKKEFAKTARNKNFKIFVVHIAALVTIGADGIKVHFS